MRWHGRRGAVYAYTQPTDMRTGFDGLSALVTAGLQRDPLSGDVYIFVSRDRVRAKVLHWTARASASTPRASSAGDSQTCGVTIATRRSR